ncbi:MAG TPA: gliding motility protein GldN [Salinivirgaceae bacterium]|nr:gliding motility protein GldN [Salinivirgaceae bacterium]
MKKLVFISIALGLSASFMPQNELNAQTFNRVGVYDEEHIPAREPVPYYYLREANVMWKKRIWRIIDMREKINHPLYFPVSPIEDRMSLTSLVLKAQQGLLDEQTDRVAGADVQNPRLNPNSQKIPILPLYEDEFFKKVLTIKDVETAFGVDPTNPSAPSEVAPEEVLQWMVKEDWFFNKERSRIEVRVIGLGAIRFSVAQGAQTTGQQVQYRISQPFWVYFPEVRPILAKYAVFNNYNDSERRTFDDIFFKRFFNSYIFRESNVYSDRPVRDYELGIYALWESEKIHNKLFNFEQDLWSY